jgi:hypothetical protein
MQKKQIPKQQRYMVSLTHILQVCDVFYFENHHCMQVWLSVI